MLPVSTPICDGGWAFVCSGLRCRTCVCSGLLCRVCVCSKLLYRDCVVLVCDVGPVYAPAYDVGTVCSWL